ncbi:MULTISPECIES: TonB-dependent receptor [Niastella]|uniref:TonB-dependent receptor n=1 Tax=Niastella soli TaxID=2821487 RepID=A0ABS3YXP2_9BACT|nr:hypothetical protein [Niastella soli]MBO9202697.1 hypothetical protein [Niastella soli]
MNKQLITIIFLSGILGAARVQAQEPNKGKTIDVTSQFKPVLREASKINFNATEPAVDTTKPRLNYNIPAQNLFFSYQPAGVNPVALKVDSLSSWQYSNFIKAGIGNIHQPYVKAGFSFGDGKQTFFNLFANHYTSKGDLPYQKNSQTSVGAAATYKTTKNVEWNGSLGFRSDDYYLYGYKPDTLKTFSKDDLKQRFQTIEGKVDFRNMAPTEYGLNYHPSIKVSSFNDNLSNAPKGSEINTVVNLPLEKTFDEKIAFGIGATADLTNYKFGDKGNKTTIQNNLYQLAAALSVKTDNIYLHAGISPIWDQKKFHMLPDIMADISTNDKKLTLQLGFVGGYQKGSYQRMAAINPWLAQPDTLMNTRSIDLYGGIKGSLGDHFTYAAKLGLVTYHNMPLFVNNYVTDSTGKNFLIFYEPRMNNLQLHSEIGYTIGETFSATAGLTWNNYYNLEKANGAYGLIPMEFNAAVRWQMIKDLFFYSELFTWTKPRYLSKNGESYKGDDAFDLNAGAEFRITKNFNLWIQLNNLLNDEYQRWNQYQVFGFSFMGGITYSFNTK